MRRVLSCLSALPLFALFAHPAAAFDGAGHGFGRPHGFHHHGHRFRPHVGHHRPFHVRGFGRRFGSGYGFGRGYGGGGFFLDPYGYRGYGGRSVTIENTNTNTAVASPSLVALPPGIRGEPVGRSVFYVINPETPVPSDRVRKGAGLRPGSRAVQVQVRRVADEAYREAAESDERPLAPRVVTVHAPRG